MSAEPVSAALRARRGIEQIPWLYDAYCALFERFGLGRWRRWLVGGAVGRTLDIGCGTGRDLPLVEAPARAIGLDPERAALLAARRRAPGVPLVQGDAQALPFRDGTFNTVISGLVFCSVPDPARGLAEVRRVLRPGGALRMLEHVRARGALKARLQDWWQPLWTRLSGGCHPNRDTERTVEAAGFGIDLDTHRASGDMRRFVARPRGAASRFEGPVQSDRGLALPPPAAARRRRHRHDARHAALRVARAGARTRRRRARDRPGEGRRRLPRGDRVQRVPR